MLDYLIQNGVIADPANGRFERGDIGIRSGKIADLTEYPERKARNVVDAAGCYVTPGLIDFHAHLYTDGTERGVYVESTCFPNGVTTAVDGGSAGVANYPLFHNTVMATSKVRLFADLNLCSLGLGTVTFQENIDPATVDAEKIKDFFVKYKGCIKALKLRQSQNISRSFGLEPLRLARKIADEAGVGIVVHVTDSPGEVKDTLDLLRAGDVFCHVFHGKGKTILDERGRVLPEVRKAGERGILFDAAHGGNQFSNHTALCALNDGFLPDFISSDISLKTMYNAPLFSMGMVISKFFNMGLDFSELIRIVTVNPARKLGIDHQVGALTPGYCADVAVLKVIEKDTRFEDSHGSGFDGKSLIKTQMTVREGICVFRQVDF